MRQSATLAFQSPDGIPKTPVGDMIRQQCQTAFFFRNANSRREDYHEWPLTESELDFILGRDFREVRYAVLVKKYSTGQSAILNIDISMLGAHMKIFNSGRPAVIEVNKAIEKYGPVAFLPHYLDGEFARRMVA